MYKHVVFTPFQVDLMLPNTAIFKLMVNFALIVSVHLKHDGEEKEKKDNQPTTKTDLSCQRLGETTSENILNNSCAWRATDCSSGTTWYNRLHVCMSAVCVDFCGCCAKRCFLGAVFLLLFCFFAFFFNVFMNPQKSHSVVRFYSQGFSVD